MRPRLTTGLPLSRPAAFGMALNGPLSYQSKGNVGRGVAIVKSSVVGSYLPAYSYCSRYVTLCHASGPGVTGGLAVEANPNSRCAGSRPIMQGLDTKRNCKTRADARLHSVTMRAPRQRLRECARPVYSFTGALTSAATRSSLRYPRCVAIAIHSSTVSDSGW